MKKLLLLSLSLLTIGLTGCNSVTSENEDKDDKFKTLEFVRQLETKEKNVLVESLKKNILSVSSINWESESTEDKDYLKYTSVTEATETFYNDSSNSNAFISTIEGKIKSNTEEKGVVVNSEYTMTFSEWDSGNNSIVMKLDKTENEKTTTQVFTNAYTVSQKEKKKELTETNLFSIDSANAYEDKKGNVYFVVSDITKTIETVQYGEGTKDHVTFEYTQKIYTIEDNKLIKYTNYTRKKTNRDPDTKDWYSDVKIVSDSYSEYELKYETRTGNSIDTLNKSVKDWVSFDSVTGTKLVGTASGTSASDMTITPASSGNELTISPIDVDNGSYETYNFNISLDHRTKASSSDPYTYDNACLKFAVTTRLGIKDAETANYYLDLKDALSTEAKEKLVVKEVDTTVEEKDVKEYYLVNISDFDCELTITVKFTSSNYTIQSIDFSATAAN